MMKIEVRADSVIIDGYVNAAGRDSRLIPDRRGAFVEQVTPGTFGRALGRKNPIEMRFNHDRVLGSTANGTLELREDSIGLRAKAVITDAAVIEKARNGELRGWSFGFLKIKDRWEERKNEPPRRYLEDIELREVSVVDRLKIPAYAATSIEVRGGEELFIERRASDDEPELVLTEQSESPARETHGTQDAKTILAGFKARRIKL